MTAHLREYSSRTKQKPKCLVVRLRLQTWQQLVASCRLVTWPEFGLQQVWLGLVRWSGGLAAAAHKELMTDIYEVFTERRLLLVQSKNSNSCRQSTESTMGRWLWDKSRICNVRTSDRSLVVMRRLCDTINVWRDDNDSRPPGNRIAEISRKISFKKNYTDITNFVSFVI